MRALLTGVMLALSSACAAPPRQPPTAPAEAAGRPNVVVIFADDLGYGDLSSYGHPTIRTPNLDRMATEGVRLTSYYAAAPACTASRAALLTGRYAIRTGLSWVLGPHAKEGLQDQEITLAEALRARGYRTAAIGKWHLGHLPKYLPTRHGFDSFLGIPYSNDMDKAARGDAPIPLLRDTTVVEQPVDQATLTRRYTDEAIRVIRESRGRPFFVYLAHSMPHLPIHASPEFRGRSRAGLYGDVVEEIDGSAGRIMETLRELGLERNTILVFASDNGPWHNYPAAYRQLYGSLPSHVGSAGHLRASKGTTYEGGMRVPGIVRWPEAIPAGRVSSEMVTAMDLHATLLKAAGAGVPADRPFDGRDALPILRGEGSAMGRPFYYFRDRSLEAVRLDRWKLRIAAGDSAGPAAAAELFDLEADPGERFDLAAEHPEMVERLRARMHAFGREIGAARHP